MQSEHITAKASEGGPARREFHLEVQDEEEVEATTSSPVIPQKRTAIGLVTTRRALVQTESELEQPLSKRKRRRLERLEKKREFRKTKRREERARKRQRRQQASTDQPEARKTRRHNTMATSTCKLRVVVDLAHQEHMDEENLRKTVVQIGHCYAANRRADHPLQFFVVDMKGPAREIFNKTPSFRMWDVFVMDESLTDLWNKEEVVYLSAESDNVLTELDEKDVYVIGGLIDHNSKKGLCLEHAQKNGFRHARLPIPEFVEMKTRKVLSVNQVFEILLHFSAHSKWEDALMSAIPKRKGAEPLPRADNRAEEE